VNANAAILRGVDRAAFAVAFATHLRARGCPVGSTAVGTFVRALSVDFPSSPSRLYWTARVCLVSRHDQLAAFDAVFAAVFEDAVLDVDPHARRAGLEGAPGAGRNVSVPKQTSRPDEGSDLPWATLPQVVAPADASRSETAVPERLPGTVAALTDVPFDELNAAQMDQLGAWLRAVARSWPTRRARRMVIDRRGHRAALRPTIARSRRTGWEPIELVTVRPAAKPRRVVLLCDVSQSMQAHTTAYLHLMRALAVTGEAEVFAFATSLTRLTRVLSQTSAEAAMEQAGVKVADRFGGTRIATNLGALLASHHGGLLRGAIVVIASDGWDSDDPELLTRAMARLRRRAHRIIWINPRVAASGFEPTVGALAAALGYCDALLPADTFESLAAVVAEISGPLSSRGSRGWKGGTGRR
jgi:uncharacterized protein